MRYVKISLIFMLEKSLSLYDLTKMQNFKRMKMSQQKSFIGRIEMSYMNFY